MRLNIRWRLTLWNTLVLAVVLACFAVGVYSLLHHALIQQTDRILEAGLNLMRNDARFETDPEDRLRFWIEEHKEHQNLFCVVYRPDGSLFGRTPELAEESVPPFPDQPQQLAAGPQVYDERLPAIGRQRIMAQRMRLGKQEFVVLLLASLAAHDRELAEVRSVLFTAGPAALLLSAGLAYWLARKALAPVKQLRSLTEAITADRLDQRLPVPNPHDELGQLTATINAMISRLERSFAESRRFTADASHELRTPLTALRTEVEVALGKALTQTQVFGVLENVLEEIVRMSRLTDQLLALSRRDAGVEQLVATPLDLPILVAGVVDALRPLAEAKDVQLRFEGESFVAVPGDEGRLRQVFINLLDNALKYTPPKGTVTVRVGRQGGKAFVAVADTGIGIPPEHLPKVFDRFYRVDAARSRADGGTGLGLSIARSIVTAHQGSIEMASAPGQGTTCTVTLPL